jgi:hypothetical protein
MSDRMNCPKEDYCIPQETFIKNVRLATAYVPFQKFCTLYSPMEGLAMGTIFPELYSPYGKMKKNKVCREEGDEL